MMKHLPKTQPVMRLHNRKNMMTCVCFVLLMCTWLIIFSSFCNLSLQSVLALRVVPLLLLLTQGLGTLLARLQGSSDSTGLLDTEV
jgi:hypothetical protein